MYIRHTRKLEIRKKFWSANLEEPICEASRHTVDGRVLFKRVFQKWDVHICV
jgi:hypothetical protein